MSALVGAGLASALASLGLRPDADARAVRRAYAQQLKQIDQATQLQAFQELRAAYESALAALARRDAQDSQPAETAPVAPPATAGFAPLDSGELAKAAFRAFTACAGSGFENEEAATAALQDALADDRLLNLEARTLFELQVAHLIMGGWQPGHEFLFGPACDVFNWEKDRAHLRVFGQLGATLDAAIDEKLIFFRQPSAQFDLQGNIIRRLRQAEMPSVTLRRADLPLVKMLVQRYPNWLRLITSQANINAWFNDPNVEGPAPGMVPPQAEPSPAPERGRKAAPTLAPWFIAMCMMLTLFKMLGSSPPPAYKPPLPQDPSRLSAPAPAGPSANARLADAGPLDDAKLGLGVPGSRQPWYGEPPLSVQPKLASPPATAARPSPPINVAAPGDSVRAATTAAPAPQVQQPPEPLQIGHVTFTGSSGDVVEVAKLRKPTHLSSSTLQPWDRLLRCLSGPYAYKSINLPVEAQRCAVTDGVNAEPGVTTYMFRVARNGQVVIASLTLRDAPADAASSPAPPLRSVTSN